MRLASGLGFWVAIGIGAVVPFQNVNGTVASRSRGIDPRADSNDGENAGLKPNLDLWVLPVAGQVRDPVDQVVV